MATTQEVLDSTKVLQERVKQEGVTINSETMQGQDPITLPETPTPTPVPPPTPTPPQETDGYNKTIMDYINSSSENKPTSGQDIYSNLYNQSGITGLQEKANVANNAVTQEQANLDAINARLNAIVSSAQQANLQLESGASGKDVTSTFLGRQQQEVARQAGIQAIPLQAQALASQAKIQSLQGNAQAAQTLLTQAQEQVDKLFSIRSQDAQNEYNYKQKLLDTVYDYATKQQQQKLDEARLKNEQEFTLTRDAIQNQYDIDRTNLQNSLKTSSIGSDDGSIISSTSQAIIDNPNLFNSLTATQKGKVLTELSSAGYDTTPLGTKALSTAEIDKVAETEKALSDIEVLTGSIDKNLQYIGPISGFQRLNPWSKANQLQADINRIKQTIGKALEGGVLRKEDEDKYKKILPTMNDTETTARYKLQQLNDTLKNDLSRYTSLLQSGGRSADVTSSLTKKGQAITGQSSSGNSYTITKE
jgi:hypothetical protein